MRVFGYDGPVNKTLERVFDLVLLHVLWAVCSLPVITIGASTAALFSVTLKMVKGEEGYAAKSFLRAFRENFRKSTLIWLCFLAAMGWCVGMIVLSMQSGNEFLKLLSLAEAALVFLIFAAMQFVFPIQAHYENTVAQTIKNAFLLSLKYLPYTAGMIAVFLVPVLVTAYFSEGYALMLFLWIFSGSSLIALGDSYLIDKVFQKCEKGEGAGW